MMYRLMALAVVAVHFGYLGYLLSGGYLAWRWPRTIGLHVLAAVWAALIVGARVPCPLTWLQNDLRVRGGQPRLADSFLNIYVRGVFYPAGAEVEVQLAVAALVIASWAGLALIMSRSAGLQWGRRHHDHAHVTRE
ncbi:MAG TPA: DUF2784 domain-containing protein [Jatrophihabitans sp.]|jgi:hypothetical protein